MNRDILEITAHNYIKTYAKPELSEKCRAFIIFIIKLKGIKIIEIVTQ